MNAQNAALAIDALRDTDHDKYLATLILPEPQRAAISALFAFSAEIAAIRDRAREPAAGEIRLQWWADALTGEGHGNVRQNPVADALLDAIATYRLPVPPLTRAIDARRFDLYQDPMPDLPTFEGYAGETVSAFLQLAAMILNDGKPVETGDAAGHLGVAQALAGHLRAFGYNASKGRIFLPLSLFAAHGVSERDILGGKPSEALVSALRQIAELTTEHADKAATAVRALPASLRPAFAPLALVRPQLARLNLAAPFSGQPDLPDWQKIARLAWWSLRTR